ncbi:fimbrillin family protein [Parabacteroides hominis]|uniref:Fimbrillin family protein n=1 Tax=Parabacteroides hominis TaxID=2763057 RepID=A0ABR7DJN5_9BACT|nr:fimbrillin family protein [Parabacteroides hominis]MBC5631567.1 fimbrillin family protein [Parabacteroides hominis]
MKQIGYFMATLMLLAFYACSDNDDLQMPNDLRTLSLKVCPELWWQSDASIGVLLLDSKTGTENQFNSEYNVERKGDISYLKPTDVSNVVLLPSDGSSLDLISYRPYSDQLDKENLSLSVDLREQDKWYISGFKASKSVSVSAPVDTAVLVNLEERLAALDIVVHKSKEGSDVPVKLTKDNIYISKVALSGTYSFQNGGFENLIVSDKYPFSLFDESGKAKGVFIPTDNAVTITYIDENGKELVFPIMVADVNGEFKELYLLPGSRAVVTLVINEGNQKATATLN